MAGSPLNPGERVVTGLLIGLLAVVSLLNLSALWQDVSLDRPGDEDDRALIETPIEFAVPDREVLPRPANRATLQQAMVSALGPTDDIGASMAVFGSFPALDSPKGAEVVLVGHRVEARAAIGVGGAEAVRGDELDELLGDSASTRLSVAIVVPGDDLSGLLLDLEQDLAATGAHVRRGPTPETFPDHDRTPPGGRSNWVELVGTRLTGERLWIGISAVTDGSTATVDPVWDSGLFARRSADVANEALLHHPVAGAPGVPGPFVGADGLEELVLATPGEADEQGSAVLLLHDYASGGDFEDALAVLDGSARWFRGAMTSDIEIPGVVRQDDVLRRDEPAGIDFLDDDRRGQLIAFRLGLSVAFSAVVPT